MLYNIYTTKRREFLRMGLFEDAVVKAKGAFDIAAKKTNEVVSIQKLKIKVSQVNSDMQKDFETLGRLYYDAVKTSDEEITEYKEIIESIDSKIAEIAEIEKEIDAQKNSKTCEKCGNKNPDTAAFCSNCGEKL